MGSTKITRKINWGYPDKRERMQHDFSVLRALQVGCALIQDFVRVSLKDITELNTSYCLYV